MFLFVFVLFTIKSVSSERSGGYHIILSHALGFKCFLSVREGTKGTHKSLIQMKWKSLFLFQALKDNIILYNNEHHKFITTNMLAVNLSRSEEKVLYMWP